MDVNTEIAEKHSSSDRVNCTDAPVIILALFDRKILEVPYSHRWKGVTFVADIEILLGWFWAFQSSKRFSILWINGKEVPKVRKQNIFQA